MGFIASGKSYYWSGRTVIVGQDRGIDVAPGDSLSIYSMAIYGDFNHINKFTRRNREPILNKDLIRIGEKIYHYDALPDEIMPVFIPEAPEVPGIPEASNLENFLSQLKATALPHSYWRFVGSSGFDLSISLATGQYFNVGLEDMRTPGQSEWFHNVGAGVGLGIETGLPGSFTFAPSDLPATGSIWKLPCAGPELSIDEICGSTILLEVAAGFITGFSFSIFLFGFSTPVSYLPDMMRRTLTQEGFELPSPPAGFITMIGTTLTTPSGGISLRVGTMHRRQCIGL